jgi:hypothetical protein
VVARPAAKYSDGIGAIDALIEDDDVKGARHDGIAQVRRGQCAGDDLGLLDHLLLGFGDQGLEFLGAAPALRDVALGGGDLVAGVRHIEASQFGRDPLQAPLQGLKLAAQVALDAGGIREALFEQEGEPFAQLVTERALALATLLGELVTFGARAPRAIGRVGSTLDDGLRLIVAQHAARVSDQAVLLNEIGARVIAALAGVALVGLGGGEFGADALNDRMLFLRWRQPFIQPGQSSRRLGLHEDLLGVDELPCEQLAARDALLEEGTLVCELPGELIGSELRSLQATDCSDLRL